MDGAIMTPVQVTIGALSVIATPAFNAISGALKFNAVIPVMLTTVPDIEITTSDLTIINPVADTVLNPVTECM